MSGLIEEKNDNKRSMFMRKFIMLMATILLCCILMTSCGTYLPDYVTFWREISPKDTIEWNDDNSITYNGTKYIDTKNTNGKISTNYDSENCVKIATMPYSYLLGAVSVFYGDDLENPTIISCSRSRNIWIKEGKDIDELILTNNCIVSDSLSFKICDVITGESIPYSLELGNRRALVNFEKFPLEDYPAFSFCVDIIALDGGLYLQYVWDSDFYKITDEFEAELRRNGFID